jgi:EAL domain-containing protein (putative c-di-GMP-specific phosphodiesterase class I)
MRGEASAEDRSARLARERLQISDAIRELPADRPLLETADAICRQVVRLTGLGAAGIVMFRPDGRAETLGTAAFDDLPIPHLLLPGDASRYLQDRAMAGTWVETWVDRPGHPYNLVLRQLAVGRIACAPVRNDEHLLGLLVATADGSTDTAALGDMLPALTGFADLTAAALGSAIAARYGLIDLRAQLSSVIARRAFYPVFQPIVDIVRKRIVGYEALTRFDDEAAPDARFAAAARVGLGLDLEIATLEHALTAARALPRHQWLDINASPSLVLAAEPLRTLLRGADRRIVLEITEHSAIDDYTAFRSRLAALGQHVSVAVDDVGAGYADLRHVVELDPAFVKIDRALIHGVDRDPARQAIVVGMESFGRTGRHRIVAEGIETEAELHTLVALGVQLGQGFLLGRPGRVDQWVGHP